MLLHVRPISFSLVSFFIAIVCHLYMLLNKKDIAFITKGSANNGSNSPSCLFPSLMNPFLDIAFINEETAGCISEEAIGAINEAAIGVIIAPRNSPSCFLISYFQI